MLFAPATRNILPQAAVRKMSIKEDFGEQNIDVHSKHCLEGEYYSLSTFGVSLDNESIM